MHETDASSSCNQAEAPLRAEAQENRAGEYTNLAKTNGGRPVGSLLHVRYIE